MLDLNHTLYRPEFEHDACGVGFIARTTGQPDNDILQMALEALGCMKHRAGVDADGLSGDGAGIMTQIPHHLLNDEIPNLPAPGDYALGVFFLPKEADPAIKLVENELSKSKIQNLISKIIWRLPPLNPNSLGQTAHRTCPEIRHLILPRPEQVEQGPAFERCLFDLRKRLENAARAAGVEDFLCSLPVGEDNDL